MTAIAWNVKICGGGGSWMIFLWEKGTWREKGEEILLLPVLWNKVSFAATFFFFFFFFFELEIIAIFGGT